MSIIQATCLGSCKDMVPAVILSGADDLANLAKAQPNAICPRTKQSTDNDAQIEIMPFANTSTVDNMTGNLGCIMHHSQQSTARASSLRLHEAFERACERSQRIIDDHVTGDWDPV